MNDKRIQDAQNIYILGGGRGATRTLIQALQILSAVAPQRVSLVNECKEDSGPIVGNNVNWIGGKNKLNPVETGKNNCVTCISFKVCPLASLNSICKGYNDPKLYESLKAIFKPHIDLNDWPNTNAEVSD